jgi:hypothetical protein
MLNSSTTDSRSPIRAHAKTLRILWIQKTPPCKGQGFENEEQGTKNQEQPPSGGSSFIAH